MTPIEFLKARLDEREAIARAAILDPDGDAGPDDDSRWQVAIEIYDESGHTEEQAAFIAANDPAYVLADIAAKRAIIELRNLWAFEVQNSHPDSEHQRWFQDKLNAADMMIAHLLLPFADRPDYRLEWRP